MSTDKRHDDESNVPTPRYISLQNNFIHGHGSERGRNGTRRTASTACDYHINRGEMDRPDGCVSQAGGIMPSVVSSCAPLPVERLIELHVEYVLGRCSGHSRMP